jgi:Flp pilus assembly protein TadD
LREAVRLQPEVDSCLQLASLLHERRDFREAAAQYRQALSLKPDSLEALNNLAWLLATCPDAHIRDGARAVQLAERACELTHYRRTVPASTLAAAYAEAGRFDDAIATAQKACALASESDEQDLLGINRELLAWYRTHQPYHEVTGSNQPEPSAVNPVSSDAEKPVPAAP